MQKLLTLALTLLLISGLASAQTPAVDIPLTISDGAGGMQELRFGLDPTATSGIDAGLGESELPPFPPAGVFEARFIGEDIGIPELGQGSYKDYRTGDANFTGMKTHELRYQVGTGTTIIISWNLPGGVTGMLQDLFGGVLINQSMTGTGNFTVTNPGAINKLKMIITYTGSIAPPPPPTLVLPADSATNVLRNPTFMWNTSRGATSYLLQVSIDSTFATTMVDQSGITETSHNIIPLENNTRYYWWVRARNSAGTSDWSSVWSFTTGITVGVDESISAIPQEYAVYQNYPNPFNPSTMIRYEIPNGGHVMVKVYNSVGQEVRTLVNEAQQAGAYQITWDGRNEQGQTLPSGIYFYQLKAGSFAQTRKLLLLR